MSKVQWYYQQKEKSESGATGTVTYDLPEDGFIPEIIVTAFSTPTASSDPALPLNKAITKIEIMDGSTVIKSLSANQLLGVLMNRFERQHASTEINDNAVEGHESFRIPLGGFFDGKEYAPDFSKFQNPQIKITWDYSLTTGQFGATFDADTTPAMKFTILCKIVRETTKYINGYVRSQQVKTWTQAVSTETPVTIAVGEKLVGIMIEAGYDDKDYKDDIDELKLDVNSGEWEPLHIFGNDLPAWCESIHGKPFKVSFAMDLIDAVEIDTHIGYLTGIVGTAGSSAGRIFEFDDIHKGVEAVGFMDGDTPTAISTYELVKLIAEGYMPYQCFYIPMSALLNGETDTLDTSKFRNMTLFLTSGSGASTSSTPAIITEHLITK